MSTNPVLGVYMITRHGDRFGFYQDPTTYTARGTAISTLGETQLYNLGQAIRARYFTSGSTNVVSALAEDNGLYDASTVAIRADAGGEGGVIFDSTIALAQGLWSPTALSNGTLANGTSVTSPLGGYQYVPVESVEPEQDVSLEGWTDCKAFTDNTKALYKSASFNDSGAAYRPFLTYLNQTGLVGNDRPLAIANGYNIFDYINVESIHDTDFVSRLNALENPTSLLQQARALGDWHEYLLFSSPNGTTGIGNIAGRTLLPNMLNSLQQFTNTTNTVKFVYDSVSYKPFVSLFNMTEVIPAYPDLAGIVDYASALTFEVRQSSTNSSAHVVRMSFKNGTTDADFRTINLFGSQDVDFPLDDFVSRLQPASVETLTDWCNVCGVTSARGCDLVTAAGQSNVTGASSSSNGARWHGPVSPVGAGFIGAGVTIALFALLLAAAGMLGFVSLGKKGKKSQSGVQRTGSHDGSETLGSESGVVGEKNHV